MSLLKKRWPVVVVGLLIAVVYLIGAVRQRHEINLSFTAGGQYPYFQNAERMAADGVTNYLGDRNRMPLVPAMLALFHSDDRGLFFDRGTAVAIVSSMVLLMLVAAGCFWVLPPWPALSLAGIAAIHVFLPKSSFAQAELAYYAFFLVTWLLMCRVLQTQDWRAAIAAGMTAALAYYSKASATAVVALFCLVIVLRAVMRDRLGGGAYRAIICTGATIGAFLLLVSPYLRDNDRRFGRHFYNVNSTIFVWMDSWADCQRFSEQHHIHDRYPDVDPSEMPSFANYVRTHSAAQMCQRVWYGVKTLTKLTVDSPYSKYLVVSVCAAVFLVLADPRSARLLWREQRLTIAFTILVLIGYGAAYSWYAVVSYGDRFILSLYLPIMFAITWCCVRLSHAKVSSLSGKWRRSVSDILALAILFAVLVEGVAAATLYLPRPNEPFVEFYFNESREAQMDGDIAAAVEGYRGVLQLEPGFGPAHHELAIVALQSGRADEAVQSGLAAVTLEPENANFVNTYGSALLQAERAGDAVAALQKAVDLNPSFASAWYNLAVAHLTLDDSENASHAILRLEALDPARAAQLRRFMSGE